MHCLFVSSHNLMPHNLMAWGRQGAQEHPSLVQIYQEACPFHHLRDVETKAQRHTVTSLWPHSISKRYHCEDVISLLGPGNHLGAAALVLAPH